MFAILLIVATQPTGTKYSIYEGTIEITGKLPPGKDEEAELRVMVMACQEGKCLLKSVIKVKP
jgi:hypothetical protein